MQGTLGGYPASPAPSGFGRKTALSLEPGGEPFAVVTEWDEASDGQHLYALIDTATDTVMFLSGTAELHEVLAAADALAGLARGPGGRD